MKSILDQCIKLIPEQILQCRVLKVLHHTGMDPASEMTGQIQSVSMTRYSEQAMGKAAFSTYRS